MGGSFEFELGAEAFDALLEGEFALLPAGASLFAFGFFSRLACVEIERLCCAEKFDRGRFERHCGWGFGVGEVGAHGGFEPASAQVADRPGFSFYRCEQVRQLSGGEGSSERQD